METELGPVSAAAVWDDRRARFCAVESVVRAGCSRLWLNTINNSTCNMLYYLRARRCQWEFCLKSRRITGPCSLLCLMKYHSPMCAAEAGKGEVEIRDKSGRGRRSRGLCHCLPSSGQSSPPAGELPSCWSCLEDSMRMVRETTQPGPGNYGLTLQSKLHECNDSLYI